MATKKYKFLARTSHWSIGDVKNLDEEVARAYWEEYLIETDETLTEGEEEVDVGNRELTIKELKALAEEKWIEIPKEIKKQKEIADFLKVEIEKLEEEEGDEGNK
jgi:hypothetical protein